MKKIFLLFMILGLSLMSFVETQAFSHTTFYGYDLDTSYQELGNISLRDFFETNNLVINHDFSNGSTGWTLVNASIVNGRCKILNTLNNNSYCLQTLFSSNTTYYTRVEHEIISNRIWYSTTGATNYGANDKRYHSYLGTSGQSYFVVGRYSSQGVSEAYIDNVYVIDITALNIQPTKDDLDFYYDVYRILKSQELAYDDGYDDGNLDGYATGFTDGTTNGQNEYHTGNYGTLDETQGIPYNDGYNAGVTEELDTNYLLSFVQGSLAVLNAPILPNITLGVFVFIPLFFGFIAFLFRLGGKRG